MRTDPLGASPWYRAVLFVSLVILFSSGMLKGTAVSGFVPVDITVVSSVLMCFLGVLRSLFAAYPLRAMIPFIAFVIFFMVHYLVIPETDPYGQLQSLKFLALTAPLALLCAVQVATPRDLALSNDAWLASSAIAMLAAVLTPLGQDAIDNQRMAIGDDAGTLGYYGAVGVVLCVARVASVGFRSLGLLRTCLLASFATVCLYILLTTASRGALLGAVAACFFLVIFGPGALRRHLILLAPLLAVVIWLTWRSMGELTRARFSAEDVNRGRAWSVSWDLFLSNPFAGVGESGVAQAVYPSGYSHNILLEIAAATGVVGLLLVLGIFIQAYARVWRRRDNHEALEVGALLSLLLAGAMVSSNINNRALWFAAVACLALAAPTMEKGWSDSHRSDSTPTPDRVALTSEE